METIDFHRHYDSFSRSRAFIEFYQDKVYQSEFAPAFWRDLSDIWPTLDAIDHSSMCLLMHCFEYQEAFLTVECQQDLQVLNDASYTIYRGQNGYWDDVTGLAWTLDRAMAERFARHGIRGSATGTPYLFTTTVHRKDIAMAFSCRNESEVVLTDLEVGFEFNVNVEALPPLAA